MASKGLYYNINKRREEGKPPKKPGQKGYPTKQAFVDSAKTAKTEEYVDEKFSTQYKDKTKLGQSSKRKSLGRGSSIKDGAKPSGYESKKEFRDTEKKYSEESYTIDKDKHNKEKRAAKIRKLITKGSTEGERTAAKAKTKGPDLMGEGMKTARKNVGADTCWDGYTAKGVKKKNGKEVPNCVKEGKSFAEFCAESKSRIETDPEYRQRFKALADNFAEKRKEQKKAKK